MVFLKVDCIHTDMALYKKGSISKLKLNCSLFMPCFYFLFFVLFFKKIINEERADWTSYTMLNIVASS